MINCRHNFLNLLKHPSFDKCSELKCENHDWTCSDLPDNDNVQQGFTLYLEVMVRCPVGLGYLLSLSEWVKAQSGCDRPFD